MVPVCVGFGIATPDHARLVGGFADGVVVGSAIVDRIEAFLPDVLTLQGVSPEQLQVISFGEERPQEFGHDEAAWRLNRRVQLLYSGY